MGTTGLPKNWANNAAEFPDAAGFNDNNDFLNLTPYSYIRNGDFELFTGSLPNNWTLSGAGAVTASDVDSLRGSFAVKVTFGSVGAILKQTGAEFKSLKGRKVRAWVWVKTAVANQARIGINDGIALTQSAFHSGGGAYERLVVTHTMAATATTLELQLRLEVAGSALFDAAVLVDFDSVLGFVPFVSQTDPVGSQSFARIDITGAANSPPTANQITRETFVRGWVKFTGADGAIVDSFNVSSVARDALGRYTVNWNTDFASADYAVSLSGLRTTDTDGMMLYLTAQSAGSISFDARIRGGQAFDPTSLYVVAIGDQ